MIKVAVVGPFSRGVSFEVHHADCADLGKTRNKRHSPWVFEASSEQYVIEQVYGDHFAEHEPTDSGSNWTGYVQEFKWLSCIENLGGLFPQEEPAAAVKPRRCYTIAELVELIGNIDPLCEPGTPEWREQTTLIRMLSAAEQHAATH